MSDWRSWLVTLVIIAVVAPGAGYLGVRYGRHMRGNVMMASILMGFGQVTDPAKETPIEAVEGKQKRAPDPGGPEL